MKSVKSVRETAMGVKKTAMKSVKKTAKGVAPGEVAKKAVKRSVKRAAMESVKKTARGVAPERAAKRAANGNANAPHMQCFAKLGICQARKLSPARRVMKESAQILLQTLSLLSIYY